MPLRCPDSRAVVVFLSRRSCRRDAPYAPCARRGTEDHARTNARRSHGRRPRQPFAARRSDRRRHRPRALARRDARRTPGSLRQAAPCDRRRRSVSNGARPLRDASGARRGQAADEAARPAEGDAARRRRRRARRAPSSRPRTDHRVAGRRRSDLRCVRVAATVHARLRRRARRRRRDAAHSESGPRSGGTERRRRSRACAPLEARGSGLFGRRNPERDLQRRRAPRTRLPPIARSVRLPVDRVGRRVRRKLVRVVDPPHFEPSCGRMPRSDRAASRRHDRAPSDRLSAAVQQLPHAAPRALQRG
jgi:hypothetical protein